MCSLHRPKLKGVRGQRTKKQKLRKNDRLQKVRTFHPTCSACLTCCAQSSLTGPGAWCRPCQCRTKKVRGYPKAPAAHTGSSSSSIFGPISLSCPLEHESGDGQAALTWASCMRRAARPGPDAVCTSRQRLRLIVWALLFFSCCVREASWACKHQHFGAGIRCDQKHVCAVVGHLLAQQLAVLGYQDIKQGC